MGVKKKTSNQNIKRSNLRLNTQSGGRQSKNQGETDKPTDDRRRELRELIWQTVALIPPGKVASYGQIARLIGFPAHSRYVGTTLRQLPKNTRLPWFRVVNSTLRISQRGGGEQRQRRLLEADGVTFIGDHVARTHHWEADNR